MLYSPTTLVNLEGPVPLQRLGHVSLVVARHTELRAVRDLHGSHERAPGRLAREAPQHPPVLFHDDDQAFLDRIKSLRPRRLELLLQIRLPGLRPARKRDDGRGPLEVEVPVAFVRGRRSPAGARVVHGPGRIDERRYHDQIHGVDLGRQRVLVGALVGAQRPREGLHVLLAPDADGHAVPSPILGERPALVGSGRRRHDELGQPAALRDSLEVLFSSLVVVPRDRGTGQHRHDVDRGRRHSFVERDIIRKTSSRLGHVQDAEVERQESRAGACSEEDQSYFAEGRLDLLAHALLRGVAAEELRLVVARRRSEQRVACGLRASSCSDEAAARRRECVR